MHTPEYISIHQQRMNIRKKVPQTEKIQKKMIDLQEWRNIDIAKNNQSSGEREEFRRPAVRQILRNQSKVMQLKVNHVDPYLSTSRYAVWRIIIMRDSALPASVRVIHWLALNVQVHCASCIKIASHCCFPRILLYLRNFTSSRTWYHFRQWDSYVKVLIMKQTTNTVSSKVCSSLSFVNARRKKKQQLFCRPPMCDRICEGLSIFE